MTSSSWKGHGKYRGVRSEVPLEVAPLSSDGGGV